MMGFRAIVESTLGEKREHGGDEDFLRSVLGLGKEYSFHHRGKWVIDSLHKLDRETDRKATERQPEFFSAVIDWLVSHGAHAGSYLFLQRSTSLGAVVDYRKDRSRKVEGDNPVVVTWLGDVRKLGKSSVDDVVATKGADKRVVLEYRGAYTTVELD